MQLASPSYQRAPSTSDLRPERRLADVLRARPDVGEPAEAILEAAVGVADHARVEAGAGHDGEALAVDAADVDAAGVAAARPMSTACSMSFGMPRFDGQQVGGAGGQDRDAGGACRRARRRSAAPCRRRPRRRPARPCGRAPSRPARARTCSSRPRARRRPSTPRSSSTRRSSGSPPPSTFLRWAITATRVMRGSRRAASWRDGGRPRRRRGPREDRDRERGEPDQRAGRGVDRVMHAAVHARERHAQRQRDGRRSRARSGGRASGCAARAGARARRRRRPTRRRARRDSSGSRAGGRGAARRGARGGRSGSSAR